MRIRPFAGKEPRFGERVFVAATAAVVGDVELADDVSVWYGAVLRADLQEIRIGARSNIQDNAVVHVDEPDFPVHVAEDVTVGHAAVLHGCRVERGALVGMHATVLNGAVIGEEAVVAAGALVPPGMAVPPRSLAAGVPARVRREVTAEEVAHMQRGVRSYLQLKTRSLADDGERSLDDPGAWGRRG
ncbi:MAG: gamma carbonic anhydrase family protein [Thermoanaerobaculaceae bacterium]|nr:gamma carbonic anhydrase family protein [Thermoanaerobaculaceae bacterium]TAM47380.1 MAG: gamma carbonic anhydrase family protein [Acidobacteriota bacterium]